MTKIYKINYSSFNEKSNMTICSINSNIYEFKPDFDLGFKYDFDLGFKYDFDLKFEF